MSKDAATNEATEQAKPPTYEELIATPISDDDANKRLAEIDIQLAQCKKEIALVEQRMADIEWIRCVILRQTLNTPAPETSGDNA